MIFQKYHCHLSAAHLQGKHNILSRVDAKWKWSYLLSHEFDTLEIDLFASRVNKQLDIYASLMADPSSTMIDPWPSLEVISLSTHFLLFNDLAYTTENPKGVSQTSTNNCTKMNHSILVPNLLQLAVVLPIEIRNSYMILPGTSQKHPLRPKLHLIAVLYSNSISEQTKFWRTLEPSFQQHGVAVKKYISFFNKRKASLSRQTTEQSLNS